MHQTLKQRHEGPSIKDVRKSGGRQCRFKGGGGQWRRGAKFQLFLGCRKSHKGKNHVSKKVAKNICMVEAKKISAPGIKWGGGVQQI